MNMGLWYLESNLSLRYFSYEYNPGFHKNCYHLLASEQEHNDECHVPECVRVLGNLAPQSCLHS